MSLHTFSHMYRRTDAHTLARVRMHLRTLSAHDHVRVYLQQPNYKFPYLFQSVNSLQPMADVYITGTLTPSLKMGLPNYYCQKDVLCA